MQNIKIFLKLFLNMISPNLARNYRNRRLNSILNSTAQTSADGQFKFRGTMPFENYEPAITKLLLEFSSDSDIFINVGANCGIFCIKLADSHEKVYAFEPLAENLKILYKNVFENNLTEKIIVFPVAVGSGESLVKFYGASTGGSLIKGWNAQVDNGQNIPIFSLDFLLKSKLSNKKILILIDVEGSEFEVIKGAVNIIKEKNAVFFIEIPCREFMPGENFNINFKNIFNFFEDYGYFSYEILKDGNIIKLTNEVIDNYIYSNKFEGVMVIFTKNLI
jgi:FkbM family methyltransferase